MEPQLLHIQSLPQLIFLVDQTLNFDENFCICTQNVELTFWMMEVRAHGGTRAPLMLDCAIKLSAPKVKAE